MLQGMLTGCWIIGIVCILNQVLIQPLVNANIGINGNGTRIKGTVKCFNDEHGFGLITADNDSIGEVFVNFKAISSQGLKSLSEGQRVEFDLQRGQKGYIAQNVQIVNN